MISNLFLTLQSDEIQKAKEALARNLPVLRAQIGITQEELCQTIGITRQTYSVIETGKKQMSQSTFMSLLLYFYVNEHTRDLLERSGAFMDFLKDICSYDAREYGSRLMLDVNELKEFISSKTVLVLGGAGNAGSAFIRKILPYHPSELYVADIDENGLAELSRDLRSSGIYMPDVYFPDPLDYSSVPFRRLLENHNGFDFIANFASYSHIASAEDVFSIEALFKNNVFNVVELFKLLKKYPPKVYLCVGASKTDGSSDFVKKSKLLADYISLSYSNDFTVKLVEFSGSESSDSQMYLRAKDDDDVIPDKEAANKIVTAILDIFDNDTLDSDSKLINLREIISEIEQA